jgi:hypothetical protein
MKMKKEQPKCEECGHIYTNEELQGGNGRSYIKSYGGAMMDVCGNCAAVSNLSSEELAKLTDNYK